MHQKNFGKENKKLNKILIPQCWILPDTKQYIEVEEQDQSMVDQSQKREKEVDKKSMDKEWMLNQKI